LFIHDKIELPELQVTTHNNQRWYKTPDGAYYPSITTVLGNKPKQYLIDWQNSLGKEKAQKETERTKKRGDAVHLMVEKYLNNDPDPTKDQDPACIKNFNQLTILLSRITKIHAQEVALFSDYFGVAGRVDCVAEYNKVLSIIDFKTSTNDKSADMIEDYFLQETFYALAFYEMTGMKIEQIITLMAVEKGITPLIFKKPITPYISKLKQRIDEFYATT